MKKNCIKLFAAGDLCPADHYFTMGHGFANPARVEKALTDITLLLKGSDLAIANLEAPISQSCKTNLLSERDVFLGDPLTASIIRSTGITHLHVANNHILQHGHGAFKDTINILKAVGIQPVGYSYNGQAISPVYVEANGLTLAMIGISLVADNFSGNVSVYNSPEVDDLREYVKQTAREVDHVIVSIHWGAEGPDIPSAFEVHLGRRLIDAGASVILGHHPHTVRPVEAWGDGLIFYSLGNLLFNLEWYRPYSIGMIVEISLGTKGTRPVWVPHFSQCRGNAIRMLSQNQNLSLLRQLSVDATWLQSVSPDEIDRAHDMQLKKIERKLKVKKLLYFLYVLPKGDTISKLAFLIGKILKKIYIR